MIDRKEVDEVWIALEEARGSLERASHHPVSDRLNCYDCFVLSLIVRAMELYPRTRQVVLDKTEKV